MKFRFIPLFTMGLTALSCTPALDSDGGTNRPSVDAGPCAQTDIRRGVNVVLLSEGDRICNAEVTAQGSDYGETLTPFGAFDVCEFFGLFDRAGTFEIEVRAPGFDGATSTVTVALDECEHALTEEIEISLTPGVPPPPEPDVAVTIDVDPGNEDVEIADVEVGIDVDNGIDAGLPDANNLPDVVDLPDVNNLPDVVNLPDVNSAPDVINLPDAQNSPDVVADDAG